MAASVTPARRPRDESDDEVEDFDVSVDGGSPPHSNRSKRARLNEDSGEEADEGQRREHEDEEEEGGDEGEDEDEEGHDEHDAPLLPDSFRRSPQGKNRAVNGAMNGLAHVHSRLGGRKTHQPGSIVRITLTDFVTYTKAEFNPGPNLNMVIGPNGTGKSTLVCAICIGLGWATKHLGRGKDLDEFVKHGAKSGQIEIELAADPRRHRSNPVITTRIKRGDTTNAEYYIDGKKENKKRVQELARSFSIQVDNLCQFLPQDRVVEFAALSPVELLAETQRAAAPQQMNEWHDQLKSWRKDQKQQRAEQQSLAEVLEKSEERQRNQEADVQRLRERAELQNRRNALNKMRPLPEYRDAKESWSQAKQQRKEAHKGFVELEKRMAPNLRAKTKTEEYLKVVDRALVARKNMASRVEKLVDEAKKKIGRAEEKIKERKDDIVAEQNSMKGVKQNIPQLQRNVNNIQKAMESPPEDFDPAAMNDEIREKTRQVRELSEQIEEAQHSVGSLSQQIRLRETIVREAEQEKLNMQSQAGKQMSRIQSISRDVARAWDWIQANRGRFQGEVYGPPLVECRVKDERHASAVESLIQPADVLAFTVTTQQDFDVLTDQLYTRLRLRQISVRASLKGLDSYRAPITKEALRQYGLEGWVLNLLEGPEPVLAMLCDNRNIHQTAFTSREISQSHFDALQQSPISSWVTSKQSYIISRRREYGDTATSTRVQDLKPARFFTESPVEQQQDTRLDERIAESRSEISELKESKATKMKEANALQSQHDTLTKERAAIEKDKKDKQSALTQFNALPTKLENAESKVAEARAKLSGYKQRRRDIEKEIDLIFLEKGQHALDYANATDQLRSQYILVFEAEVQKIEASSDVERLAAQHEEEERLLEETRQEVQQLHVRERNLLKAGQRLQVQCQEMQGILTEQEQKVQEEIEDWGMEQWNTEIVSLEARLESLMGGGNENTLREFEQRAKDIEEKRRIFNGLVTSLEQLEAQIADIREQWEPRLDELVEEISEAFAENFSKIQCAGEVGVHKDEDFEHWAIQIKVKFRENEPLSLLDSHRQSGGERAVSTVFYLMALQSLARAPFRVVDEINQGMDPRNERLVHSRMVDIACAEVSEGRQGSQYFLITPKLLQGLKYHPDMRVHCIASGEHMPRDFRETDFAGAARKALELRGQQAGVVGG